MDRKTTIEELKTQVRDFCEKRDWDQYHNAKELAVGIVTEAGELLDLFRFKSEAEVDALFEDAQKHEEISEELADTLYFILLLAHRYDLDLTSSLDKKMKKNAAKYPVDKAKGQNKKYSEL